MPRNPLTGTSMFAALWLALAAPPVFIAPCPNPRRAGAIAGGRAGGAESRCYRCVRGRGLPPTASPQRPPKVPHVDPREIRCGDRARRSPCTPGLAPDWRSTRSHSRFNAGFGYEPCHADPTSPSSSARLPPAAYADHGTRWKDPSARSLETAPDHRRSAPADPTPGRSRPLQNNHPPGDRHDLQLPAWTLRRT